MGTCLLPAAQLVNLYHLLVPVISFFFPLVIKSIIAFHVSFTGLTIQGVTTLENSAKAGRCNCTLFSLTALFWDLRED